MVDLVQSLTHEARETGVRLADFAHSIKRATWSDSEIERARNTILRTGAAVVLKSPMVAESRYLRELVIFEFSNAFRARLRELSQEVAE